MTLDIVNIASSITIIFMSKTVTTTTVMVTLGAILPESVDIRMTGGG